MNRGGSVAPQIAVQRSMHHENTSGKIESY